MEKHLREGVWKEGMDLKELGLSDYEERAYEALVKHGKASASDISRSSKVSYGKIYEVLASLEQKGLAKVVPEKAKKFVPTDPKNLLVLVERKEAKLSEMKKKVGELKKIYDVKEEEAIEVVKGHRNFYKAIREMKEPRKFKYTIKHTSEFQPEWARQDRNLHKRKVEVRSLVRHDKETEKNVKKWLRFNPNIREMENRGVALDIRDSEVMISLIRKNTLLLVKDEAFVAVMKELFNARYDRSRKLKG